MIVKAIRDAIVADGPVSTKFATWDFGDGIQRPAVFTQDPAPEACKNPVCVITQDGGVPHEVRGGRGAEVDVNVRIWGDKQSDKPLRALAWLLWEILDRADLTITGWDFGGAHCSTPQHIQDGDGFPGYTMNVRVRVIEQET